MNEKSHTDCTTWDTWDTLEVERAIDNDERLYRAKQTILWSASVPITPSLVREWCRLHQSSIDAATGTRITWNNVRYEDIAESWEEEFMQLTPGTLLEAITLSDLRSYRAGKGSCMEEIKRSFESDCKILETCLSLGIDINRLTMPMPSDYER